MSTVALLRKTDESERFPEVRGNVLFDLPRIERAVREMLFAVGEDPDRDGLVETPRRVARAYAELLGGLREDPAQHLGRVFEHRTENDDLVLVRDIEFSSLCEHHLLPFTGTAQVAYLPDKGRVVGLSKIARTVDVFARRPQLQERLTADIADAISEHLEARAVAVVVRAEHLCLRMRGAAKRGADMVTTAFRGEFARNQSLRAEVLGLLRPQGGLC
ncbi:MAG TPA: GTP cyclohydrolase I FolE [Candidatus Margulisiibacteriota bacterium]|nr:GTP cyclohydrolase I FolE [Candidatus Margulisiibacteriota bacterium]